MRLTPLEQKITDIVAPVAEDHGLEIVSVKLIGEGGSRSLQIMAENPATKNLGIDECTKLSKAISAIIDVEDPIDGAYRLEISSPGIDRMLTRLKDFETYKGMDIKAETTAPTETGQKRFRGIIQGIEGDDVILSTDQGEVSIPFSTMAKAKLVMSDALIKATKPEQETTQTTS